MALPTLQDYFGSQSEVVTDVLNITSPIDANNPALIIPLAGLASTGFSEVAVATGPHPDPWFFALAARVYAFSKSDVDEKTMIEIADPTLNLSTRDGQVMEVQDFRMSVFKRRSQNLSFDPDHIRPDYVPAS